MVPVEEIKQVFVPYTRLNRYNQGIKFIDTSYKIVMEEARVISAASDKNFGRYRVLYRKGYNKEDIAKGLRRLAFLKRMGVEEEGKYRTRLWFLPTEQIATEYAERNPGHVFRYKDGKVIRMVSLETVKLDKFLEKMRDG